MHVSLDPEAAARRFTIPLEESGSTLPYTVPARIMLQLGPFSMDGRLVVFNVVRVCIVVALRSPAGFSQKTNTIRQWLGGVEPGTQQQTELARLITANVGTNVDLQSFARDPESQRRGEIILSEEICWQTWNAHIRSRVLKDLFHVFNMFYLSVVDYGSNSPGRFGTQSLYRIKVTKPKSWPGVRGPAS
ncbi:hypothetical protein B0H13DRAFT_1868022 [Mycena leptocephala]|nr:hypothetical protein B0H13DRAFT_1868022 [Mycena leptocephala]